MRSSSGTARSLEVARALAADLGIAERVSFDGLCRRASPVVEMIASCDVCLSPDLETH